MTKPVVRCTLFLLFFSAVHAADIDSNPPFFPTQKGTEWTYHREAGKKHIKLSEVKTDKDSTSYTIGMKIGGEIRPVKTIISTKDGIYEGNLQGGNKICLLKLPYKEGQRWKDEYKSSRGEAWLIDSIALKPCDMEVPAGKYTAFPVVSEYSNGNTTRSITRWHVRGIGIVQEKYGDEVTETLESIVLPK